MAIFYLIKRSLRLDSIFGHEWCVCAKRVTDRKWWFLYQMWQCRKSWCFSLHSLRCHHIFPMKHQRCKRTKYVQFLSFFVSPSKPFLFFSRFDSKVYSFILCRSSFLLDCARSQRKFISWNDNLLHWKHVRRLCSHVAHLALVRGAAKDIRLTAAWVFRFSFFVWHLNRTRCALDVIPRKSRETPHCRPARKTKKQPAKNRAHEMRQRCAVVFDIFIIAASFKSISFAATFFLLHRIMCFYFHLSMSK